MKTTYRLIQQMKEHFICIKIKVVVHVTPEDEYLVIEMTSCNKCIVFVVNIDHLYQFPLVYPFPQCYILY